MDFQIWCLAREKPLKSQISLAEIDSNCTCPMLSALNTVIPSGLNKDCRFGSKVCQIGPKWDKSGAFSDQISVHLATGAKCSEIWSEKAPDLSHLGPIWPTLEPNLPSLAQIQPYWHRTGKIGHFKITFQYILTHAFFDSQN